MRFAAAISLLCLGTAAAAHAQPSVAVVIAAEDSGLCSAIRVQLAHDADVRCREPGHAENLGQATLTVWIDTSPQGALQLRTRNAEGVTDTEVLGAAPELALERTVALKVREWWDRPHPSPEPPEVTPAAPTPATAQALDEPESAARLRGRGTAAFGLALTGPIDDIALLPGARVAIGGSVTAARWRLDLTPTFQLAWLPERQRTDRSLEVRDHNLGLDVTLLGRFGPWSVGGWVGPHIHFIHARGRVGASVEDSQEQLWSATGGGTLRYAFGPAVSLDLQAGIEIMKQRQRFDVGQVQLLDMGRFRAVGAVSLFTEWP